MNIDNKLIFEAYALNGLATGKTIQDIAKKHKVQPLDIKKQIEKGTQVEHEHTGDEQTAKKIAMDHVFEDPKYYDKLKKIETKSENEEQLDVSKYKSIIDDLSRGEFDTESKKEQVDQGAEEGVFDVEVVDGKRQVVLTNAAVKKIESIYPELKDKFWECGRCKADYPGCGEAKRELSENAEMPTKDFAKLKQHINKGPIQIKKPSKELPYTHKYMHDLAKQDPREGHKEENDEKEEEGDLMAHMKQQGMIAKDATSDTGKYGHTREEEEGMEKVHPSEKKYGEELKARQEMERKFREWLKNNPDKAKHYPQKRDENEERRLDPKCWKGYHKQGTKLKGGVRVNNCVKNKA